MSNMANLFGKNKLRDISSRLDTEGLQDKIDIVKTWHHDYHKGSLKQDKETSREQAYNQDFFIQILGYKEKPAVPYSLEPKATTDKGQLPDAVLSYTDTSRDIKNIAAAVELKGASVELDRPQRREGNMSPVQQGFKYKTQYRNCPFVVVSNFWELRLYHDNQLDYELWTLDDLVDPEENYLKFKTFYTLLHSDNLTSPKGSSKTEELLSDIRFEQEEIGKKFYKVYRQARLDLLRDIYRQNESIRSDIDTGIEKAQKIIDRVVFACFAEDRGLLPDDTLRRVIKASDNSAFGGSLWATLKAFFEAIDVGSEKLEIPDGYNGGLFAVDSALNNLKIGDQALRSVIGLSDYNFVEDLSVTILGHIFEQSISDLEEIKIKVNENQNLAAIQQSRRKKDGIFYTPDYIVRYIVDNSLGTYLREYENKFKDEFSLKGDINDKNYEKREQQAYVKYQEFLHNVKVVDPACGSGAFLVYVFDYLLAENKRVASILGNNLFSSEDYIKSILQNNIYGVDLNEESVEITKLSLWLKTAQKGKKLTVLDGNIKCGNSLIDDPSTVGNKAFNWQREFADIMQKGGFDVVIGNPPYVRQELIKDQIPFLSANYKAYSGKADLYVYFFELATRLLKVGGLFGYISSGKFIEANYGKPLLEFLTQNTKFENVINFGDLEVFEGVTAYPLILIARKSNQHSSFNYVKIDNLEFSSLDSAVTKDGVTQTVSGFIENNFKFHNPEVSKILTCIKQGSANFTDIFPAPTVGIKTGLNEAYQSTEGLPYVFGRDIKKYQPVLTSNIIFPYKWSSNGYVLLPEHQISNINQLLAYKDQLSKRAVISDGIKKNTKIWYEYQQINKQLNFDMEYIVYPNVSLGCNFTLSKSNIIDMTGFIIPTNSKYLLAILNSSLFRFFMQNIAISRRGGYHEFKTQYITQFPVKNITSTEEVKFNSKTDEVLRLSKDLQATTNNFKNLISSEFGLVKWPSKLNKWWKLDLIEFVNVLKVKLSLQQKDELLKFFEKYRMECTELDTKIQESSNEINQLVYKLYGLNEAEVAIIEQ